MNIKNNSTTIILLCLLILASTGCGKNILNQEPRTSFSEKDVWSDISLIKKFKNSIYNGLGTYSIGAPISIKSVSMPGTATEMAYSNWPLGQRVMNEGTLSPENLNGSVWGDIWERKYKYIRRCNIFLKKIDSVKIPGIEEEIKKMKGEVIFLRAKYYNDLIKYWGGVPLITNVFGLNDDFKKPRAPYEKIVDWIVNQLDEAKKMVPSSWSPDEFGKVTKGACVALKSNVLLYANSKLHNNNTKPGGPLYDYSKNTWQEVADAAKEVIDMSQYSLYPVDTWKDYKDIWLKLNPEMILVRVNHAHYGNKTRGVDFENGSPAFGSWGDNVPTQNAIDAFEMKNGKGIYEIGSGYDPSPNTIYKNRELRFYADILFQGAEYKGRELEYFIPGGADSPDGEKVPEGNGSKSGYNFRKFGDESYNVSSENTHHPWIFIRLAEMYLNYAEAQYYLGNEDEARKYINIIRNRVHLPDIHTSVNQLLNDIRHERKIELCYEHKYFFDVRRWMIVDSTGKSDLIGIQWKKVNNNGELDPNGKLTYKFFTLQKRKFYKKLYYLPIPIDEVRKAGLKQNFGY